MMDRDVEAILYGGLSVNEYSEVYTGINLNDKLQEELPFAYAPEVHIDNPEKSDNFVMKANLENDRKEFKTETLDLEKNIPEGLEDWLKEEKNLNEQEVREAIDTGAWEEFVDEYARSKGKSWEELVYPGAVDAERKYIEMVRNEYGFVGGRCGGPFPRHAHYNWKKEIEISDEEFKRQIAKDAEEFVKWVAKKVVRA